MVPTKKLVLSLVTTALLVMTAPRSSFGVGVVGAVGGRFNGAAHGGSGPAFHDMHPSDREGRFDRSGRFDGFRHHHGPIRFGYPICFAYPYCPYPTVPCLWEDGHWAGDPGYYNERAPVVYGAWVPPGCC